MSGVEYRKKIILTLIDKIKQINSLIIQNDIDEETKNKLIKTRDESERCLRNTTKTDFLIAGGSLKEFNELVSVLDDKQEVKQEVKQEDKQEDKPADKPTDKPTDKIELSETFKLNIEDIKKLSFNYVKHDSVFYTDVIKLKNQVINTILTDNLNHYIIEYYLKKIELLKQYTQSKDLIVNKSESTYITYHRHLEQLRITLETVKNLESLRTNYIISNIK